MRFDIKPRYYDPVKEEVHQRTEMIKRQLQADGLLESKEEMDEAFHRSYGSSLRGAFTQGSPIRGRSTFINNTGIIRLLIILILLGSIFGYVYYGNTALYILLYTAIGIALLLFLFRLRRSPSR